MRDMPQTAAKLDALVAKIDAATMQLHRGEAEDVARVSRLQGAMGQSFTTTVFAFQQASSVRDGVAFIADLAGKYPRETWLGTVASEQFRRPVGTLRTRYAMRDTADMQEAAANLSPELDGEGLLRLARTMMVHYAFLLRRIRDLLPFYELSVAFEGHKLIAQRVAVSPTGKGLD
jgi:hypothetical protein